MPAFGDSLSEADIDAVLAYVKSFSGRNITLPQYLADQFEVAWLKYKLIPIAVPIFNPKFF